MFTPHALKTPAKILDLRCEYDVPRFCNLKEQGKMEQDNPNWFFCLHDFYVPPYPDLAEQLKTQILDMSRKQFQSNADIEPQQQQRRQMKSARSVQSLSQVYQASKPKKRRTIKLAQSQEQIFVKHKLSKQSNASFDSLPALEGLSKFKEATPRSPKPMFIS